MTGSRKRVCDDSSRAFSVRCYRVILSLHEPTAHPLGMKIIRVPHFGTPTCGLLAEFMLEWESRDTHVRVRKCGTQKLDFQNSVLAKDLLAAASRT